MILVVDIVSILEDAELIGWNIHTLGGCYNSCGRVH